MENLAKIILDTLKDYNYRRVNEDIMKKLSGKDNVWGLTNFVSRNLYVLKGLSYEDTTITQLHEFGHAYFKSIGHIDKTEKNVDKLAYEWKRMMDDVYGKRKHK